MREVMHELQNGFDISIFTTKDKSVDILNFFPAYTINRCWQNDALPLGSVFFYYYFLAAIHLEFSCSHSIEMDMEKVETEFEFYNFTLDSLKKDCEYFHSTV